MIPTGRQIREARDAIGWKPWQIARAAGVTVSEVILAEVADDRCPADAHHASAIRRALEAAGVTFTETDGEGPGARLRSGEA